jgi:hypothetical protein
LLQFHQHTAAVVGEPLVISAAARQQIAEKEAALGVRFPASVVEFFSITDSSQFFEFHACQHLVPLDELGLKSDVTQDYLRVAWENQGVVQFFVRLSEGDDPPVYDDNDESGPDLTRVPWNRISSSFSEFVFDLVAPQYCGFLSFFVKNAPYSTADMDAINACLSRGPASPGSWCGHRFYSENLVVTGVVNDTQIDWVVMSRTPDPLRKLLRALPPEHALMTQPAIVAPNFMYDSETWKVLAEFGRSVPRAFAQKVKPWWRWW